MFANFYENSIGIFFIGNYSESILSENQINAVRLIINEGISEGKIASNYLLFNKHQLQARSRNRWSLFDNQVKRFPHYEPGEF